MASYKVKSVGFIHGSLKQPGETVHVENKFKKCPSWLQEIKPETAAEKKKRLAEEKKAAEEAAKEAAEKEELEDSVTFTDDGSSSVETL